MTRSEIRALRRDAEARYQQAEKDENGRLVIVDERAAKNRAVALAAQAYAAADACDTEMVGILRREIEWWSKMCSPAARRALRRGLEAVFG